MHTAVVAPILYPQPLPSRGDFRGQALQDYEASYASAVAATLGVKATGNRLSFGGYSVTLGLVYYDYSCSGRVGLSCHESELRGWMKDWPLRKGVPVKPETVAAHIRTMVEVSDDERERARLREQMTAANTPLRDRLLAQCVGAGVFPAITTSTTQPGVVYVTIPRVGFACTEMQAAALIAALAALPTSGLQRV